MKSITSTTLSAPAILAAVALPFLQGDLHGRDSLSRTTTTTTTTRTIESDDSRLKDVRSSLIVSGQVARVSKTQFVMVYILDPETVDYLIMTKTPEEEIDKLFAKTPDGVLATWIKDERRRLGTTRWNAKVAAAAYDRYKETLSRINDYDRTIYPQDTTDLIDASAIDIRTLTQSDFIGLNELHEGIVRLPDGSMVVIGPGGLPGAENYGSTQEGTPDTGTSAPEEEDEDLSIVGQFLQEWRATYDPVNSYLMSLLAGYIYFDDLEGRVGEFSDWGFDSVRVIQSYQMGAKAAVLKHEKVNVVVFCGTEGFDLQDWTTDLNADMVMVPHYGYVNGRVCKVHEGFNASMVALFSEIRDEIINENKPIFVTGHSLGGAMAELFAFKYQTEVGDIGAVYTIGAPRVGNQVLVDLFQSRGLAIRTHRVANPTDPATLFPSATLGYRHPGNSIVASWVALTPYHHHDNWLYSGFLQSQLEIWEMEMLPPPFLD